jgi:hypothetical protein
MDQRGISIKQNIEGTRAAIDEKLEMIERCIHVTMEKTRSAIDGVTGSINLVKSILRGKESREDTTSVMNNSVSTIMHTLDGTIERIKYTTELIGQVKQNSWIILGGGVLVGYVMGRLNREESVGMRSAHAQVAERTGPERPASGQGRFRDAEPTSLSPATRPYPPRVEPNQEAVRPTLAPLSPSEEGHVMDAGTFADQWMRVRGQLTTWWDQLTEADLEAIAGQKDALVRLVQEKYRYTRERAQEEVNQRLQAYSDMPGAFASGTADTVKTTRQDVASSVAQAASEAQARATDFAATAATTIADMVHDASSYLQETPVKDLTAGLVGLVRRYPIPSVLIGMGVGYLLARSLGKDTTARRV